jgi:hypothetical protein
LIEGEIAGLQAAIVSGLVPVEKLAPRLDRLKKARGKAIWQYHAIQAAFLPPNQIPVIADPDTIICRCEDVSSPALTRRSRRGMEPCVT